MKLDELKQAILKPTDEGGLTLAAQDLSMSMTAKGVYFLLLAVTQDFDHDIEFPMDILKPYFPVWDDSVKEEVQAAVYELGKLGYLKEGVTL